MVLAGRHKFVIEILMIIELLYIFYFDCLNIVHFCCYRFHIWCPFSCLRNLCWPQGCIPFEKLSHALRKTYSLVTVLFIHPSLSSFLCTLLLSGIWFVSEHQDYPSTSVSLTFSFSASTKSRRKKKIRRILDDTELGEETKKKIAIEKVNIARALYMGVWSKSYSSFHMYITFTGTSRAA